MKIKVVNKGHQPLPEYATPQSAGMDLRANIDSPITLKPMARQLVPTGLYIALPAGADSTEKWTRFEAWHHRTQYSWYH